MTRQPKPDRHFGRNQYCVFYYSSNLPLFSITFGAFGYENADFSLPMVQALPIT